MKDFSWDIAVEIDCEVAFPNGDLPPVQSSIALTFLDALRTTPDDGERDPFLPSDDFYVRKEVKETFAELIDRNRYWCQILIGSPGVGKSILLFLVCLFQSSVRKKPVLFIRKTKVPGEYVSAFYIKPDSDDDQPRKVSVDFARDIDLDTKLIDIEKYLVETYSTSRYSDHKRQKTKQDVLLFLDGFVPGDEDLKTLNSFHYLSTSAGCDSPSGEQEDYLDLVILSAWEKESLRLALLQQMQYAGGNQDGVNTAMEEDQQQQQQDVEVDVGGSGDGIDETGGHRLQQQQDATLEEEDAQQRDAGGSEDELLEELFFHTGGRIREAISFLRGKDAWIKKNKKMIAGLDTDMARLAITDTKSNISEKSMDRLRTMFRAEGHPGTHQIVDSQFYARELRLRLGAESFYNAFKFALDKGLLAAAGCHFEELMHECFKDLPAPVKKALQSVGTGAEGVSQLDQQLFYWIPRVPNFANIDAAIVDASGKLWCIQYTVSATHSFNTTTFRTKFLRPLSRVIEFGADDIEILFVVPNNITFTIPEDASLDFSCTEVQIDCSSIETVIELPFPFLDNAI